MLLRTATLRALSVTSPVRPSFPIAIEETACYLSAILVRVAASNYLSPHTTTTTTTTGGLFVSESFCVDFDHRLI